MSIKMTVGISGAESGEEFDFAASLAAIAEQDVNTILVKNKEYGDSWKSRGGIGAYMMLARKIDRIENQVKKLNYDIFKAINTDTREEGIIDDIRDLRAYLLLVETQLKQKPKVLNKTEHLVPGVKEFVSHGYTPEINED